MSGQIILSGLFTDVLAAYRSAKGRQTEAADAVTVSLAAQSDAVTGKSMARAQAAEIIAASDRAVADSKANTDAAVAAEITARREVLAGLEAVRQTADSEIETVKASLPPVSEEEGS